MRLSTIRRGPFTPSSSAMASKAIRHVDPNNRMAGPSSNHDEGWLKKMGAMRLTESERAAHHGHRGQKDRNPRECDQLRVAPIDAADVAPTHPVSGSECGPDVSGNHPHLGMMDDWIPPQRIDHGHDHERQHHRQRPTPTSEMLDHPGGSTHPVGALTGVRRDSASDPVDLTVDHTGHLHVDIRVQQLAPRTTSLCDGIEGDNRHVRTAVEWDTFTPIPS